MTNFLTKNISVFVASPKLSKHDYTIDDLFRTEFERLLNLKVRLENTREYNAPLRAAHIEL